VLDVHRRCVAALGVALPEARFETAGATMLVESLKACARAIGEQLTP
jgi:DNA-binding IclR family transcriptional regulator